MAHRVLLVAVTGDHGDTLEVDHRCNVRPCVALGHLRWLDHRANVLRGSSPPARNARRTHCPREPELEGVFSLREIRTQ